MPHTDSFTTDKHSVQHLEEGLPEKLETVQEAAADGHAATDRHGNVLVAIDHAAEAAIRRKCDLQIVPIIALCYLFCFIDRSNIGNARTAGLERDLGIAPTDYGGYGYNLLLTAFYIAYVVFELPASLICKKVGPGRFVPFLVFMFGLFSFAFAFIGNFGGAFALRFCLGIFEAMFLPSIAYYLSRFYRKAEYGFRVGVFFVGAPMAGAFGGLLASGFLSSPGFGMVRTWRIIFFGEGLITMGLGVLAWFLLPDSPSKARFLTPEQRILAVARIKSENVGSTELLDSVHQSVVRQAMFNPTTLTMVLYFLLANLPVQGLGFFLPSILRSIYPDISTVTLQLRTVPPYVVGAFTLLLASYLGWKTNCRGRYMLIFLPCLAAGYAIFLGANAGQARYAAVFLIAMGSVTTGPLCTTWATVNTTSDTARAATLSAVIFGGNIGGLIATWTYIPKLNSRVPRESQIPGNSLNLAGAIVQWFLTAGLLVYQHRENRQKEKGRDDWRLEGVKEGDDALLGQKHPAYRFLY
ncbi:hypothetical protein JCM11251_004474 [Rhodosporidiobolus azoricus]